MTRPQPEEEGASARAFGRSDTFDDIVAGWLSEGTVPSWPEAEADAEPEPAPKPPPPPPPAPLLGPPYDLTTAHDHFVPPDPPPLPRMSLTAMMVLILVSGGIVLLAVQETLRLDSAICLPLGLILIASGLGWMLLRCWPGRCADDDTPDDGAIV